MYIAEGHGCVVDLDLEKFFNRVNHDKLMGRIANRIEDKRLLKHIRAFLDVGVIAASNAPLGISINLIGWGGETGSGL